MDVGGGNHSHLSQPAGVATSWLGTGIRKGPGLVLNYRVRTVLGLELLLGLELCKARELGLVLELGASARANIESRVIATVLRRVINGI